MSKEPIAREVADQFGTTFDDAMRFVDDLGEDTASKVVGIGGGLVDDSRRGLPDIPTGPWAKAGTAATLNGGALLWKRENRLQDQSDAKEGTDSRGVSGKDTVVQRPPSRRASTVGRERREGNGPFLPGWVRQRTR